MVVVLCCGSITGDSEELSTFDSLSLDETAATKTETSSVAISETSKDSGNELKERERKLDNENG